MINVSKYCLKAAVAIAMVALLSACGGDSNSTSPTTVPNSVTVAYAHNLVFRNSTTLSTGYNAFGQLGTGNLANRNTAGYLSGNLPFTGAATGAVHSVAFFNISTVRSWGYNGFGQLGNNSTTYSSTPVSVFNTISSSTGKKTVNLSRVTAVAAGALHSLALRSDDTLWAWGNNGNGQLGVINPSPTVVKDGFSKEPVRVGGGIAIFSNISSIAAGGHHSLARADGKVWAWGLNGSGQLGIDPQITGASAIPNPVPGLPGTGVSAIAAGGAFNYALYTDGTVWAWGNNFDGQLGNGTSGQDDITKESVFIPAQVLTAAGILGLSTGSPVVQIAAGIQHGLARLADRSVWAWGYNIFGQLGNNGKAPSSFAVQVFKSASVPFLATDIRAFGSSSMAKDIDGVWYAWGDNAYGQLGTGGGLTQLVPARMSGF